MKKRAKTLLFVMIILVLTACGNSSETGSDSNDKGNSTGEEKELADKLHIFNWADVIPQESLDQFEEEFGVEIVYSNYSSEEEMFAKVQSGTVAYDIVFPSSSYFSIMKEQGLLQELDLENIPNFENLSDMWTDLPDDPGNKYSIPVAYGTNGILYNKDKVETPTSWEDLWNPEYEGQVVVLESQSELFDMLLQSLGYDTDLENVTEEQIEEAAKKLEDLIPNLHSLSSDQEPLFMSEQALIGYGYCAGASVANLQGFDDLDCVLPDEGGLKWHTTAVIPNTSKEKYTAEVFLDWYLRPEVSLEMVEVYPYPTPNEAAVELYTDEMKELPSLNVTDEELEGAESQSSYSSEQVQLMDRLLQEIRAQ